MHPLKTLDHEIAYLELVRRLSELREDSERQWGVMTPHQMLCHMADTFRNAMGERQVKQIDFFFSRTVMKWGSLWVPISWPKGLKTLPELDQAASGTAPDVFANDRQLLLDMMSRFRAVPQDFISPAHSLLGPLTRKEWMRLMYLHLDHHLRQFRL